MTLAQIIAFAFLQTQPGNGDEASLTWLRLLGLAAVTAATIVIFALIFRPIVATRPHSDDARDDAAPDPDFAEWLSDSPESTPSTASNGSLIQFPGRPTPRSAPPNEASQAAAERLRRLTSRSADSHSERRRLGFRRGETDTTAAPVLLDHHRRNVEPPGIPVDTTTDAPDSPIESPVPPTTPIDQADSSHIGEPSDYRTDASPDSEPLQRAAPFEKQVNNKEGNPVSEARFPESWDSLEGLAIGVPFAADRSTAADTAINDDADLLGDIVNRRPSEADHLTTNTEPDDDDHTLAPVITGDVPTAQDIEMMELIQATSGKIVRFVPRESRSEIDDAYKLLEEVDEERGTQPFETGGRVTRLPVDTATRDAITSTVQELLFCANVGEFMHGFALYTDRYLFQFMTESGMNEDTFRETFQAIPAKETAEWTLIESVSNIERHDDGRVSAHVQFRDGDKLNGTERFTFKIDKRTQRWLIDDIQAI